MARTLVVYHSSEKKVKNNPNNPSNFEQFGFDSRMRSIWYFVIHSRHKVVVRLLVVVFMTSERVYAPPRARHGHLRPGER